MPTMSIPVILDRSEPLKPEMPPSQLLRPSNRLVPMIGRGHELQALAEFCEQGNPFQWMVLSGPGGIGKTRLALELARERQRTGWVAGFLPAGALLPWILQRPREKTWTPAADTLVIVDHAAGRFGDAQTLLHLFNYVARRTQTPARLRVLLIEREGDMEGAWLGILRETVGDRSPSAAKAMGSVLELGPPGGHSPEKTAREIFVAAGEHWRKVIGDLGASAPTPDAEVVHRMLRGADGNPLLLQLAALRASQGNSYAGTAGWGAADLLMEAANCERAWVRTGCEQAAELAVMVERTWVLPALTGPIQTGDRKWRQFVQEDGRRCGCGRVSTREITRNLGQRTGMSGDSSAFVLQPIEPRWLAEACLVTVLQQRPQTAKETLAGALRLAGPAFWDRLFPMVASLAGIDSLHQIRDWTEALIDGLPDLRATDVFASMPGSQHVLAGIENVLWEREVAHFERLERGQPGEFTLDLARSLHNLAMAYGRDRRKEAVATMSRSCALLEQLAAVQPETFEARLAHSLENLCLIYIGDGNAQAALATAERAQDVLERLMERQPNAPEPGLPRVLNLLSSIYRARNEWPRALQASQRAVVLAKDLAAADPVSFAPLLAESQMKLTNLLGEPT